MIVSCNTSILFFEQLSRHHKELGAFLTQVQLLCQAEGLNLFLAGGSVVRAMVLQDFVPRDLDFVTENSLEPWWNFLERQPWFKGDYLEDFLMIQGETPWGEISISRARKESWDANYCCHISPGTLAHDALRRDFSSNTIYWNAAEPGLCHNFYRGIEDLASLTLRSFRPQCFAEDPSRFLRGLRFILTYGLEFEDNTVALLKENSQLWTAARFHNNQCQKQYDRLCKLTGGKELLSQWCQKLGVPEYWFDYRSVVE